MITAVLIDTLSIQQYIFSSSKLREQIGASYIVEKLILDECIPLALQQVYSLSEKPSATKWETDNECKLLEEDSSAEFEIGYIGGGNALVLFRNEIKAREFIQTHSLWLLQHFPGIKTAYAIGEDFAYENEGYKQCRERLSKALIQNRNCHATITVPFKPGVADDCNYSGEAMEHFKVRKIMEDGRDNQVFASSVTYSKQHKNLIEEAQKYLTERLLSNKEKMQYAFTDNQEKLGQPDEKGYIAIVHADGNGMGQKFLESNSLARTRQLSVGTKRYADSVMKALILDVIEAVVSVDYLNIDSDDENRRFLPIRPIIAGGDDITFICEGRLGMYLAERLLKHMTEVEIAGEKIQACAGVVLIHSKFPFYKAYKLCEEVTKEAKKCSRGEDKKNTSWLHYHLSSGGFSGSLEDIIQQEFTVLGTYSLKYGPYVANSDEDSKSIKHLRKRIQDFSEKWPRGKAKELRDILRKGEADQQYFKTALSVHRDSNEMLTIFKGQGENFWEKEKVEKNGEKIEVGSTPYFDAIELLDFYPTALLEKMNQVL